MIITKQIITTNMKTCQYRNLPLKKRIIFFFFFNQDEMKKDKCMPGVAVYEGDLIVINY